MGGGGRSPRVWEGEGRGAGSCPTSRSASGWGWHREPWAQCSAGEETEDETAGAEAQLSLSATGDAQRGAAQPSSPSRGLRTRPPPARSSRSSSSSSSVTSNPSQRQQQLRSWKAAKEATKPQVPKGSVFPHQLPPGQRGALLALRTTSRPTACAHLGGDGGSGAEAAVGAVVPEAVGPTLCQGSICCSSGPELLHTSK